MNEKKLKPKKGLSRCLELAADKKGLVIGSMILSSLAAIASFVSYLAIYLIIREIIQIYPDFSLLDVKVIISYAWFAIAGIFANILIYFLALLCSHLAAFGTLYELKIIFAKHLTKIPLGYHYLIGSGRMRKIMDENIESIEGFIAHQLPDLVASFTAVVVMMIILLAIDWRYGLVSMLGIVLAVLTQFLGYGGKEAKKNMQNYQTALEDMSSASVEYIRGMSVIKAFNQGGGFFKKLDAAFERYTQFAIAFSMGWKNWMPAFTTIINNIYLFLIPLGIYLAKHTTNYPAFVTTFIFYLIFVPSIAGVLNKIMYISESFMKINGDVARMDEILNIPENKEALHSSSIKDTAIILDHVSFAYDKKEDIKALDNVSFKIPQGKITAIVGPSGGGKSTIANLICRFYDVDAGNIKIGDVDIRDLKTAALMETISFVFQDTFLFKISIKENIRIGKPDATDEEIIRVAKLAQCHDFIMKLPQGYDTLIGVAGTYLSGGEKQRITIARAMIKNAPILVLDEASSFCDIENEYLIQKALRQLMKNKTVIMIAHRLSTVQYADQIIVLEQGRLIEKGRHDELLKNNGRYAAMWHDYTEAKQWKVYRKAELM